MIYFIRAMVNIVAMLTIFRYVHSVGWTVFWVVCASICHNVVEYLCEDNSRDYYRRDHRRHKESIEICEPCIGCDGYGHNLICEENSMYLSKRRCGVCDGTGYRVHHIAPTGIMRLLRRK